MHTAVGLSQLIQAFRLVLSVDGLRPHTIHNYVRTVERFAAQIDGRKPHRITAADVRTFIASLQDQCAAKTVCEAQLALRRFFRFLLQEGELVSMSLPDWERRSVRVDGKTGIRQVYMGTGRLCRR